MEESLDNVNVRKAQLSFMCRMNADYKEIEHFLATNPEALLFGQEESILEEAIIMEMRQCKCFGKSCNENRKNILRVLRRGFEFYRGISLVNSCCDNEFFHSVAQNEWEVYCNQLIELERDLRILKSHEIEVENRLTQASQDVSYLRNQLEKVSKRGRHMSQHQSSLLMLKCRKVKPHIFEERTCLENKLATATLHISSIEKEQKLLRLQETTALRLQHALLKKSFSGCRRHVCEASNHGF
jgi:hypothetical protein